MTRNQLPEGVGKKIVEALKKQNETVVTPVEETEMSLSNEIPLTDIQDVSELKFDSLPDEQDNTDNIIIEEETLPAVTEEVVNNNPQPEVLPEDNILDKPVFTLSGEKQTAPEKFVQVKETTPVAVGNSSITIPPNVQVLKNLIASLPVGVTKQTGAQIIRQTLEAMGLPMNSVLKEAQDVQEELNSSTRECMLKIQEYKTNILQLEQSVQEYQKNITQINDLVSLFLLTDRK